MRRSADATQPPQQQQQQQQHNTAAVAAEMAELRARAEEAERVAKEERRRSLALRTELERERAKHAKALEVEAERTASALAAAADAKTTADKLARRERRLLDQQSQWADAQLTTKKGREELERATAELEEVKSAARAQDRRHKMETERLRSRNGDLSSRVNELEDEVRRLGVAKLAAEERAAAAADAATRRERRSVAEVPTSSAPMTMSMSTTSSSGAIAAKAAASPASPLRASEPAAPSGKRAPRVVRFHDPLALHATQTQTQTHAQASKQQHKPSLNKQNTQHSEAQRAHASLADLRAEVESLGASQFSKHKKKKYMDEKLSAVHGIRKQKQQRLPQNIGLGIKRKSVERSKKEAEHLRLSGMELSLRSKKLRKKARRAKKAAN